mmetsp:Transcript_45348/g.79852  ORF Transcript_45348/g.79852 Transcript_45348/m.79852 type:complete len:280 (+) Transcript_45348:82-921(+)
MAAVISVDEHVDPNYEPTEKEISEYSEWLGFNLEEDKELLWIARDGLKAPLPFPWKPCQTGPGAEIFYFNFATGESVWDHPCDEFHRRLFYIERKKLNGEALSQEDREYLQEHGREDLESVKIGTLVATWDDAGVVEVSALSLGGEAFASTKLKYADGSQSFRSVQKALTKQAGQPIRLILPNGRMLEKDDDKTPIRDMIELSNADAWPEKDASNKDKRSKKTRGDAEKLDQLPGERRKLSELPPLKIAKKHGYRHFGSPPRNASAWTVDGQPDPVYAI